MLELADRDELDELEASIEAALDRIGDAREGVRADSDPVLAESVVRAHTEYESVEAFRADAPVDLDTPPEDAPARRRRLNEFVRDATDFETWAELEERAAEEELVETLFASAA